MAPAGIASNAAIPNIFLSAFSYFSLMAHAGSCKTPDVYVTTLGWERVVVRDSERFRRSWVRLAISMFPLIIVILLLSPSLHPKFVVTNELHHREIWTIQRLEFSD